MLAAIIQNNAPFVGKTVQESASVFPGIKFMPIAIERSGSQNAIIPRGDTVLREMTMFILLLVTMVLMSFMN